MAFRWRSKPPPKTKNRTHTKTIHCHSGRASPPLREVGLFVFGSFRFWGSEGITLHMSQKKVRRRAESSLLWGFTNIKVRSIKLNSVAEQDRELRRIAAEMAKRFAKESS